MKLPMEQKAKRDVLQQVIQLMDQLEAKGLKGSLELEKGENEEDPQDQTEGDSDVAKLKAMASE